MKMIVFLAVVFEMELHYYFDEKIMMKKKEEKVSEQK